MVLLIFQVLSIVLQVIAMLFAIRLIKSTKYNASWMFFIVAIWIITLQRIEEFVISLNEQFELGLSLSIPHGISVWSGVVISVCISGALFLVRKFVHFIKVNEIQRNDAQEKTLNAVIEAEERQRQRFAKELHDGLGPLLSTAQMSLSAIKASNQMQKEIIANAEQAISLALKSVKSTSGALSSHILENFGLSRAVSNMVKNINPLQDLDIKFYTNIGSRRFSAPHELVAYRVVTELLTNSFKHSNATQISLDVVWSGKNIDIVFSDNGVGFDPAIDTLGMGLRNIRSRVESVKGDMEFTTSIGNGINVSIHFLADLCNS